MEIFVKKGQMRIDDPRRHPSYERDRRKGEQLWKAGKMKFENEAQKRDYLKRVNANPANVVGIPAFAPPLEIKSYISMPQEEDKQMSVQEIHEMVKEKVARDQVKELYFVCVDCRGLRETSPTTRVTLHQVSRDTCYCMTCGRTKDYRLV